MTNQSSMIGSVEGGSAASHSGSAEATPGSASERAQTLRASLSVRRDAESLFAEASQLRRAAAAEADAMVAEAELLAEQLIAESTQTATRTTAEATERAEELVQRARTEAAELTLNARAQAAELTLRARKEVEEFERQVDQERARLRAEVMKESRAEIEAIRQRSDMVLNDIEAGVRGMGPKLEGAMNVLIDVMRSLEQERAEVVTLTEEAHQSLSSMGTDAPAEPVSSYQPISSYATVAPYEAVIPRSEDPAPSAPRDFERPAEPFVSSVPSPFAASASVASFARPVDEQVDEPAKQPVDETPAAVTDSPAESPAESPADSMSVRWAESSSESSVPAFEEPASTEAVAADEIVELEESVEVLTETPAEHASPDDFLVDPLGDFETRIDQTNDVEPTDETEEDDELTAGRHSTMNESVTTVAPENTENGEHSDELGARPLGWLFRASQG